VVPDMLLISGGNGLCLGGNWHSQNGQEWAWSMVVMKWSYGESYAHSKWQLLVVTLVIIHPLQVVFGHLQNHPL
jgi:hypothetical protein